MTLILIDVSGWIYAAYHRLPNLQTSAGEPTGAVYGVAQTLWRFLREPPTLYTHVAAVFDYGGPTWRAKIDPSYKQNREAKPNKLSHQGSRLRQVVALMGVTPLECEGYEADDILATYTRRAKAAGIDVVIVSADKDMYQLLDEPRVQIWNSHPRQGPSKITEPRWITANRVERRFGVPPRLVTDVQALAGDSSDGYAGVPGIGDKTAGELVTRFGSLEGVIAEAQKGCASFIRGRGREAIVKFAERARVCKRLATLDPAAEIFTTLDELRAKPPDVSALLDFLAANQMTEFAERFKRELPGALLQREEAVA